MEIQPDFKELLALFNEHKVEFLIVGGFALAFHGAPRFTGDLDVLVRPQPENARRALAALAAFGFNLPWLTADDFQAPDKVVQLGLPPVRIDLMTSISGVTWEEVVAHKVEGILGDIPVSYIGRDQFIANKRASGRKKDLADIEALDAE